MSDNHATVAKAPRTNEQLSAADKDAKTHALIAYALMCCGFFTGITFIAGVIWAYVKKGDALNTPFYDHYNNLTTTFWVSLVLSVIGGLTAIFVVGYFIALVAGIYTLFKLIKGLARLTSNRAYNG